MKYFFLTLITLIQLSIFSPVYAGGAMGGGASEWTQILNKVSLVVSEGANKAGSLAQVSQTANDMIGKPLATALINRAVDEVANETIAWANGGYSGTEPTLIIPDPEQYIKNQGLVATKRALESIPEDSIFGDSIFSAIYEQNRDTSMEDQLTALSQSNISSILYNKYCNDSQALTDLAIENVREDNGTYDLAVVADEVQRLDAYMCSEDPTTSKEAASRLEDINNQNPNLGGWDSWLSTTQGDNEYTKSVLAKNVAVAEKEKKEAITTKNIYDGVGALSQTECLKPSPTIKIGEVPACLESRILTAGKTVDAMLSQAANAGAERLSNLTGEGIAQAVVGFAVNKLVSGIATYKPSSSAPTGDVTLANVTRVKKTITAPKQDLVDDPSTKKATLKPMVASLTAYLESLTSLEKTDSSYLQDIRNYEGEINKGKACYQDLVTNKGVSASDSQIVNAFKFYEGRQATVTPVKNMLIEELDNISSARTLAENTLTSLRVSNSSKEIDTIFADYQDTVDLNNYPTPSTDTTRQGEYAKNKYQVDNDTNTDPSHLGEMARTYQTCQTIGMSLNNNNNFNIWNGN